MSELEAAWTMLFDAVGMIPRGPEGAAVVVFLFLLWFFIVCIAIKFLLWLPEGIRMLLLFLWGIFKALLRRLFWRADEESKRKPRKIEDAKPHYPKLQKPPGRYMGVRPRIEPKENEGNEGKEDEKTEAEEYGKEEEGDLEEEHEEPAREERQENEARKKPEEPKDESPKSMLKSVFLERKLTERKRAELVVRGYRRLKISAFGDSGASYYLVKPRWNEGLKHAFFCHLVESELWKRGKRPHLNVIKGPDISFEHEGAHHCFEVETGTNLERHKGLMEHKFALYEHYGDRLYILVTRKKLKSKYRRYGTVITRASLRKALDRVFIHI